MIEGKNKIIDNQIITIIDNFYELKALSECNGHIRGKRIVFI